MGPEEPLQLDTDNAIALTDGSLQALAVLDSDLAPRIVDQTSRPRRVSHRSGFSVLHKGLHCGVGGVWRYARNSNRLGIPVSERIPANLI